MGQSWRSIRVESTEILDSESTLPRGNFAFVETLLGPNRALIVKLTALKRISCIRMALSECNSLYVYSQRSLEELRDKFEAIVFDSEVPEAGDELAVRISPEGAVHISHNNRVWIERTHVDPNRRYHVVFDMESIDALSMIGIATCPREEPAAPPAPPPSTSCQSTGALHECVICCENARDVAIKPCSHVVLCEGCAGTLRRSKKAECPICRSRITGILKLYFS